MRILRLLRLRHPGLERLELTFLSTGILARSEKCNFILLPVGVPSYWDFSPLYNTDTVGLSFGSLFSCFIPLGYTTAGRKKEWEDWCLYIN